MEPSIYEMVKINGIEFDSHESNLYIKDTIENWRLLTKHYSEFLCNVRRFRNQIDGQIWLDIPFAYDPWWIKRLTKKETK